jgi:uncharacterized protein with HEPN domain
LPPEQGPTPFSLEIRKYLFDIERAAASLHEFTAGKTLADYEASRLLQAAVEREFEIIGEAVSQLAKRDPALAERIPDFRRLIAFRNLLIHGYADVDHVLVWGLLQTKLPELLAAIRALGST